MARKLISSHTKALILARCDVEGTEAVAKDLNLHRDTIARWRMALGSDDKLRSYYQQILDKRIEFLVVKQNEQIEDGISVGLMKWLSFMQSCAEELDPADPDAASIAVKASEVFLEMLIVIRQVKARTQQQQSSGSDRQLKSAQA